MTILFQLGHPAHYHLFKNTIMQLKEDGHRVYVLIKKKDILEDLLQAAQMPYRNILPEGRKSSKIGILWGMFVRLWRVYWFTLFHRVNLLAGSTPEVAQVGWLLHRESLVFAEDDAAIVPEFVKLVSPFVNAYLSPITCNNGRIEYKTIHYAGFHKLAYLHPNRFVANRQVVEKYFDTDTPYFLLRFAQLKAYHDISAHAQGITTDIAQQLIDILEPFGRIYITSERELEPQFEKYRLQINPLDIHHVMAFATLYIGDSQSMAVEAAMLGTPSIRFNDFAGKIGVLEELEHKYQLTIGIPSSQPQQLYDTVKEWVATPNLHETFQQRRQKMLSEKIDVTAFFTWFIENYPESEQILRENPDYQFE